MQVGTCPLQKPGFWSVFRFSHDLRLLLRGSQGLVMSGAQSRTTPSDDQRAGGLCHNSDFITGEHESKDWMTSLLDTEAQIQQECDSVSRVTRVLRMRGVVCCQECLLPVCASVGWPSCSPQESAEGGTCSSAVSSLVLITPEKGHQEPGPLFRPCLTKCQALCLQVYLIKLFSFLIFPLIQIITWIVKSTSASF